MPHTAALGPGHALVGLDSGPKICISDKLPGDANLAAD